MGIPSVSFNMNIPCQVWKNALICVISPALLLVLTGWFSVSVW